MQSHIGCICKISRQCEFSNVPSKLWPNKRKSHIGCICKIYLQSEFLNVASNYLPEHMLFHIGCIHMIFSRMNLQMPFQIAWPNSCKITLVAMVRLFTRVYFLMSLQIANLRRCKVTLVTFVRLLIVLIFQRDSHRIWRSAHPDGKYWLTYKPTIKFMFMFDLASLFKLSLSFKNHAIYTSNSNFSIKLKKLNVLVASPLISGAAGNVYVSRSMQIKIGFSYANRAKCFCKSTCLCVCKSGASNVSINNVHRLN